MRQRATQLHSLRSLRRFRELIEQTHDFAHHQLVFVVINDAVCHQLNAKRLHKNMRKSKILLNEKVHKKILERYTEKLAR